MPEAILAPNSSWFAPTDTSITRASITEIGIVDSYTILGNETASWDASAAKDGSVMCYVTGTKLTIAGNGSGCIYVDGYCTFSNVQCGEYYVNTGHNQFNESNYDKFENVSAINGLENLNVSRAENMNFMFALMYSLSSFEGVANWDTSNVKSMASMFYCCTSLTSLKEIASWNTGSVEDMDHLFASREHATTNNPPAMSLTEIDVENWDVSNVLYMGSMFYGCYLMTEFDLNKWDTSKVWDINHMFCDCINLTSLNISNWDVSNCQFFSACFNDCNSLTVIDLSGWDTKNARTISQMFEYCDKLTTISGIEKFDTSMLGCPLTDPKTGEEYSKEYFDPVALYETFHGCKSLTELDLSSFDTKNVGNTVRMVGSCSNLKTIYVSDLWSMESVVESEKMFIYCHALIGEEGTARKVALIDDVTYARIDGGADAPGYFTHIQNRDVSVLVKSKSLYGIGKSIRKALDTTDKYKPSEMASAINSLSSAGGSSTNAVRGTFTLEADTAIFSIDNLPFNPCNFTIGCSDLYTTPVANAIVVTCHTEGVTGNIHYYNSSKALKGGTLDPTDPNVTGYTDNSLTINYTGWGMYFKAGYTYDYIISGGFEE